MPDPLRDTGYLKMFLTEANSVHSKGQNLTELNVVGKKPNLNFNPMYFC
jgi:hypothetical protein